MWVLSSGPVQQNLLRTTYNQTGPTQNPEVPLSAELFPQTLLFSTSLLKKLSNEVRLQSEPEPELSLVCLDPFQSKSGLMVLKDKLDQNRILDRLYFHLQGSEVLLDQAALAGVSSRRRSGLQHRR